MNLKADPRPLAFRMGADDRQPIILADQGKRIAQSGVVRLFEGISFRVEARFEARQEPGQIGFAADNQLRSLARTPCSCIALDMSPSIFSLPVMNAVMPSS